MTENTSGRYFLVNGLNMYYESHGTGRPIVLLHGGMTTIGDFALLLPSLAETRHVIAVEQQGHGHTADMDRPLSLEQMADDTAALLKHLQIEQVDVFGYSFGGAVALALTMRHPELVRKLVLTSTIYAPDGYPPEIIEGLKHATAEFMPPIMREAYAAVAPHPEDWPKLVAKATRAAATFKGWQAKEIQSINAPTFVIVGDADIVRTEHAVELFRLLPHAQLAVLPGADHITILFQRSEWILSMLGEFLDAPMPDAV